MAAGVVDTRMSFMRVQKPHDVCIGCDAELSETEQRMYEYRCEYCEGLWHARVQAWRAGAKDAELSRMFDA